jgi:hypothetical protein
MGGASETYREKRIASRVLGGKPEGMRPFGRIGLIWVMSSLDLTFERNSLVTFSKLKFGQLELSLWFFVARLFCFSQCYVYGYFRFVSHFWSF